MAAASSLRMTETILSTLDPTEVMERIIDQVGQLVRADNLGIETYDSEAHQLRPILARGGHTERFMARHPLRDQGVAAWVAAHGSAQLVPDELADAARGGTGGGGHGGGAVR